MDGQCKEQISVWVEKVLKNLCYENINVKFDENQQKGGHLSDLIPIEVTCQKLGKSQNTLIHLIVKKGKVDPVAKDVLNLKNIYKNEINVYSKIVPYFENFAKSRKSQTFSNIPKCYGTIEENDQYVVFIENLKSKNFELHEIETTVDLAHTRLVLEAYANWHALSFASKDQEPVVFQELALLNKRECCGFGPNSKMFEYMIISIQKELDTVIGIFREKGLAETKINKLGKLRDDIRDMYGEIEKLDEKYLVIRHGDCWNNNFLFHYNNENKKPDKVVIVDWQLGVLGSPVLDIALYIFHCCSRKELDHLDDLLDCYYKKLSNKIMELGSNPENCFPKQVFLEIFNEKCAALAFSGTPVMSRMSCRCKSDQSYDISTAEVDGNFSGITAGELRDPEGYLRRIDEILELCIQKRFL